MIDAYKNFAKDFSKMGEDIADVKIDLRFKGCGASAISGRILFLITRVAVGVIATIPALFGAVLELPLWIAGIGHKGNFLLRVGTGLVNIPLAALWPIQKSLLQFIYQQQYVNSTPSKL